MGPAPQESSAATLARTGSPAQTTTIDYLRSLLVLGRISNLPSVWSNCLAAWLIAGAGPWRPFLFLLAAAPLLYLGGMFLNDFVDAGFDRRFRPQRPIPLAKISRGAVLVWIVVFLASGLLLMLPLGTPTAAFAAGLIGAIILYDLIHKHTDLAPFLMGGCRFLLYLTAGASAKRGQIGIVVVPALGMAAYVTGLSLFARRESDASKNDAGPAQKPASSLARWGVAVLAMALLAVPLVLNPVSGRSLHWDRLTVLAGAALWILWCLRHGLRRNDPNFSRGVSGLLAGIVLIDWLAAPVLVPLQPALFAGLFLLALILQKIVPAT